MWLSLMTFLRTVTSRAMAWIAGLWDSKDPTTEVKLVAFGCGVLFAIVALAVALIANGCKIYSEWNDAFFAFCGLIAVGAIIEKTASKKDLQ